MSTSSARSTRGVKRFNAAHSSQEQSDLNRQLANAALDNEPELVLHYLSQGANPSSKLQIVFELLPNPASVIAEELQTLKDRLVPDHAKLSTFDESTVEDVSALHAAVINCCWTTVGKTGSAASKLSKVKRIVKALLEAGADASHRSSFLACHIPGYRYYPMHRMTPLDLALKLQVVAREQILEPSVRAEAEFQCIIDLLLNGNVCIAEPSVGVRDDFVATIDRESRNSIHIAATNSLRAMLSSASETFSDLIFECAAETTASSSETGASSDSGYSVESDRSAKPKRSKKASSSSSHHAPSNSLDQNPSPASSAPSSTLVHAHRSILFTSSPYFRALFSGAWCDVSDGRILAKQGARAIRRMLEFVYTGEMTAALALQLPFEDLVELHEASAEYQIDALRAMTEAALAQNVSALNLVRMLQLATLHDGTSCTLAPIAPSPLIVASTSSSALSSSSSMPSSLLSMAPCMLMNACVAVLKNDMVLLTSDGLVDFLGTQPKLRAFLRAALAN